MYLKKSKLRIGLDLDQVIFDFINPYIARFGLPKDDYEITKNVQRVLIKDKSFWINQPLINYPNFDVALYCTKRVHNKNWTKEQLRIHNLPKAPIYQVYLQSANKADKIKGKVDLFIDDSISNMIQMNLSGLPCLLFNADNNQEWGPIGRIYSLDKDEIEDTLHLFKQTIFPYFKELIR